MKIEDWACADCIKKRDELKEKNKKLMQKLNNRKVYEGYLKAKEAGLIT